METGTHLLQPDAAYAACFGTTTALHHSPRRWLSGGGYQSAWHQRPNTRVIYRTVFISTVNHSYEAIWLILRELAGTVAVSLLFQKITCTKSENLLLIYPGASIFQYQDVANPKSRQNHKSEPDVKRDPYLRRYTEVYAGKLPYLRLAPVILNFATYLHNPACNQCPQNMRNSFRLLYFKVYPSAGTMRFATRVREDCLIPISLLPKATSFCARHKA